MTDPSTDGTEQMIPLPEVKELHSRLSEESSENSQYYEYAVGVAWSADELRKLIKRYEDPEGDQ